MPLILNYKYLKVRAAEILNDEGISGIWFRFWGKFVYRRLEAYIRDLDSEPLKCRAPKWPIVFSQLKIGEIPELLELRDTISQTEAETRLSSGQICFVARLDNKMIYSVWFAPHQAWIDYLSFELPLRKDEGYLYESFCADQYRGGEVATNCQAYLQKYLKESGIRRIIGAVLKENGPGIRAVLKAGFFRVGTLRFIWFLKWQFHFGRIPERF